MLDRALISTVTETLGHLLGPEETLHPSVAGSSRLTGCAALVLFPEEERMLYRVGGEEKQT